MPKLYYKFGCMGSSKTANALMAQFNYNEKGFKVLFLKSIIDTRDGGVDYINTVIKSGKEFPTCTVSSRIGLATKALVYTPEDDLFDNWGWYWSDYYDAIIVDECQFLTAKQVDQLKNITILCTNAVPVLCYGLRTDFTTSLFEGSRRLFEIADSIAEIKSVCKCGAKTVVNAKYYDGEIQRAGNPIDIGGNEKYIGMCYKCWLEGKI